MGINIENNHMNNHIKENKGHASIDGSRMRWWEGGMFERMGCEILRGEAERCNEDYSRWSQTNSHMEALIGWREEEGSEEEEKEMEEEEGEEEEEEVEEEKKKRTNKKKEKKKKKKKKKK